MSTSKRNISQVSSKATRKASRSRRLEVADRTHVFRSFDKSFIDQSRLLTVLLSCDPFSINGVIGANYLDQFIRCFSAISRNHDVSRYHLEWFSYRYPESWFRDDEEFRRCFDDGWNKRGDLYSRELAICRLKAILVQVPIFEIDSDFLNYVFDHPAPDFHSLNRHHGWTSHMNDPAYFIPGGKRLLIAQVEGLGLEEEDDPFD